MTFYKKYIKYFKLSKQYLIGRCLVRLLRLRNFSYSLYNEDNIIDWLTGYKKQGIYIDIGAYDPNRINNTKLFYQRGWRGINIEPNIKGYELFCLERPYDINLNYAIGNGEVNYYCNINESAGNTCSNKIAHLRELNIINKIKLKQLR